jgi:hypothetical protein
MIIHPKNYTVIILIWKDTVLLNNMVDYIKFNYIENAWKR